ncbi:glycosyltransferase [Catenovulum maritimum]|uniref:Glycosyl transferase family 1 n=1 Tax=Catenovulum maritimum TaxID=1513271 RepID=A0A0J8GUT0_9ALTE|nr:glycosyltransferase [Catenovulum maritimum]KMT64453.1 hypothetical protein XM47_14260 [Catenovulum maritimum]
MKHIVLFLHDFRGGGAERVSVRLANGLVDLGARVNLIVLNDTGPMKNELNPSIMIHELTAKRMAFCPLELGSLVNHLAPDIVISHMTHANVSACLAAKLFGFSHKLIVVEHNVMQTNFKIVNSVSVKLAYLLTKLVYRIPKKVIAVSAAVKGSITRFTGVENIEVIFNPVVNQDLLDYKVSSTKYAHPWFHQEMPVFVAVGSLTPQKNFKHLLKSFALLIKNQPARLLILGEGPQRAELELDIVNLGILDSVELLGYVGNVYDFIAQADALIMSSAWEGLPTVLIEALSLSTKVVSTNCEGGSAEILAQGQYGILVPVHDCHSLAQAMKEVLTRSFEDLKQRASLFSIDESARQYYNL